MVIVYIIFSLIFIKLKIDKFLILKWIICKFVIFCQILILIPCFMLFKKIYLIKWETKKVIHHQKTKFYRFYDYFHNYIMKTNWNQIRAEIAVVLMSWSRITFWFLFYFIFSLSFLYLYNCCTKCIFLLVIVLHLNSFPHFNTYY